MITFDNVAPPEQPTELNENPTTVKTDTSAIDGTPSRMQMPSKGRAKLIYKQAKPETYQFFKALYDAAQSTTYKNTESNLTGGVLEFTGIIDFNEGDYIRGGSKMVPLEITIMEGRTFEV